MFGVGDIRFGLGEYETHSLMSSDNVLDLLLKFHIGINERLLSVGS